VKKIILCLLFFCFVLVTPLYTQETQQTPVSLVEAIDESVKELTARIRSGSMIVVFGIQAPTTELSAYITDGILDHLVSKDEMKIVDRQNPDLIAREHEIQLSGDVSDEYIQGIGHQFGAEVIITGSLILEGNVYQLRLQALNVRTAQVLGRTSRNVSMNTVLANLLNIRWIDPNAWKQKRWYIGARGGLDINFYNFGNGTVNFFDKIDIEKPFGGHGTVEVGVQINDFFALQLELVYMRDTVTMIGDGDIYYSWLQNKNQLKYIHDFFTTIPGWDGIYFAAPSLTLTTDTLLIPILAKLTARPSIFELSGLAGVYFTIPLGNIGFNFSGAAISNPNDTYFNHYGVYSINDNLEWDFPPLGLMAGANFGIKLGPGVLFTDIRFMMDFMPIKNKEWSGWIRPPDYDPNNHLSNQGISTRIEPKELFERRKIVISLGYKIGLGNRRR
jgi:hypothetical protein